MVEIIARKVKSKKHGISSISSNTCSESSLVKAADKCHISQEHTVDMDGCSLTLDKLMLMST